jgi:hypothetical protein
MLKLAPALAKRTRMVPIIGNKFLLYVDGRVKAIGTKEEMEWLVKTIEGGTHDKA